MSRQSEITIVVSDPAKCNDKFGQVYISYKITSTANRPGFTSGTITVVRRYSDFSWLSGELSREFPGVIVPPLPEKQTVGRFGSEFVESRRRGLEKFLQRIASHNEIGNSEFFVTFLQADEAAMLKAKGDAKAAKPALASKAMAWFDVTVNNIANGKAEIEKSAADTKIEEISQYILALEKQMVSVTKHSEGLVKRSRELSSAMFEFGQSITWLGQSEGDVIGTALTQMGSSVDSLSVAASSHAEQEAIKLLEPLEEYARMLTSIKYAMQQRTDKKSAYVNAMGDLEAKQNAYKKLLGVPGKESQAAQKEAAVQAAQEATDAAKLEFEKVSERLLAEFETFKTQKASDMKEILLNFVTLQIEFNKKSEEAWRDLLPKMQAIAISEPSSRGGGGNGGYSDFASMSGSHQSNSGHNNPFANVSDSYNKSNFQEADDDDEGMVGV